MFQMRVFAFSLDSLYNVLAATALHRPTTKEEADDA